MAKTEFLQIRCSPEDRDRLRRAADSEYLDLSTWARRVLLQELDRRDGRTPGRLKVVSSGSKSKRRRAG